MEDCLYFSTELYAGKGRVQMRKSIIGIGLFVFLVAGCATIKRYLPPPDGSTFKVHKYVRHNRFHKHRYSDILRATANVIARNFTIIDFDKYSGYIRGRAIQPHLTDMVEEVEVFISPNYDGARSYKIEVLIPNRIKKGEDWTAKIVKDIKKEIIVVHRRTHDD
jgi:hypothetical protein